MSGTGVESQCDLPRLVLPLVPLTAYCSLLTPACVQQKPAWWESVLV